MRMQSRAASINLTSLIDIFTVLVFFLLLNMGDGVEQFVSIGGHVELTKHALSAGEVEIDQPIMTIGKDFFSFDGRKYSDLRALFDSLEERQQKLIRVAIKAEGEAEFKTIKSTLIFFLNMEFRT